MLAERDGFSLHDRTVGIGALVTLVVDYRRDWKR